MIDANVKILAAHRLNAATLQSELSALQTAFAEQHADLLARLSEVKAAEAKVTGEIRAEAVDIYTATGEQKPTTGVSVKLYTVVQYDPAAALKWAIKNKMALTLNTEAFEALVKAGEASIGPDLALLVKEPRSAIAKDLSGVLASSGIRSADAIRKSREASAA
jgi:hypothetical protein